MKQRIRKLCKQLSRFNFDEITSILELPKNDVHNLLKELINENVIKQISKTEFAYIPKVASGSKNATKLQTDRPSKTELPFDITTLLANHEDQQKYLIMQQRTTSGIL